MSHKRKINTNVSPHPVVMHQLFLKEDIGTLNVEEQKTVEDYWNSLSDSELEYIELHHDAVMKEGAYFIIPSID